jgi:hypothetical protein
MKQADAQLSRIPLLLICDNACADVSPNTDVAPTKVNAQDAAVARPMEEMNARTCWNSLNGGGYVVQMPCQVDCIVLKKSNMRKATHITRRRNHRIAVCTNDACRLNYSFSSGYSDV